MKRSWEEHPLTSPELTVEVLLSKLYSREVQAHYLTCQGYSHIL